MRRNGNRVDIEVIDNGPGLPKQNRIRLTEPYVTTKGAKGTGLGLAIVQKSVEQHAGLLSLEDAPPAPGRTHGALIRISLPAHPADAPARSTFRARRRRGRQRLNRHSEIAIVPRSERWPLTS